MSYLRQDQPAPDRPARRRRGATSAADLIDHAFLSYNAGRLREVCQVFTRKMLEPDCTVGPDALGRPDARRAGDELPDPPDPGRVRRLDRLDRGEPLPRHPLRPRPAAAPEPAQPRRLTRSAQNDIIRIYDIVFDYKTLLDTDAFYRELIRERGVRAADGHGRVPLRGRPLPPRPGRGAGPARATACSPRPTRPACRSTRRAPATARSA